MFVSQIERMSKHEDCSSGYVINENMCFELKMPMLHSAASCLISSMRIVLLKESVKSAVVAQHCLQNVQV